MVASVFLVLQCRALAAATLGPNYIFELVGTNINDAYGFLANRSIDVLLSKPAGAMEDDIYQVSWILGKALFEYFDCLRIYL